MSFREAFDHLESCPACQTGECAEGTRLFQKAHGELMRKMEAKPEEAKGEA